MGLEPVIGCPDPGGELTASKKLATHFIIPFRSLTGAQREKKEILYSKHATTERRSTEAVPCIVLLLNLTISTYKKRNTWKSHSILPRQEKGSGPCSQVCLLSEALIGTSIS
ncbi:hypothetical protein U1Q18_047725 [Sarracenia purpurea var. burkii]